MGQRVASVMTAGDLRCWPGIETPQAVENADAIAAVPGVDALLVGTNDLCMEMGIPGEIGHPRVVEAQQRRTGTYYLYAEDALDLLFTENETNAERLWGLPNARPYVKDSFHRYLVHGETGAVNPDREGTKVTALYDSEIAPGTSRVVRLRLSDATHDAPFVDFERAFELRQGEADLFYEALQRPELRDHRAEHDVGVAI